MGHEMELNKFKSVMRTLFVAEFGRQMMRTTDPVAEYGVVYDQLDSVKRAGETRDIWYGNTDQPVPYWKLQLNKNQHGGVIFMGDQEFLEGNMLAFYWIHKRIFDTQHLTKAQITELMERLCVGLYNDHLPMGIKFEPVHVEGESIWGLLLSRVWEMIGTKERPEGFCIMTDVFPMDKYGRRELGRVKVTKAVNHLIDTVRRTMDEVESFENKKVIKEMGFYDIGFKFTGTTRTQDNRINRYYRDKLGFSDKQKLEAWINTIKQNRDVHNIEDLAGYMGIATHRVHQLLRGSKLKPTKTQLLDKLLTESILAAKTKSEVMQLSGKPRSTVYRRLDKNKQLKFLWERI